MPVIKATVDTEVKTRFRLMAKAHKKTQEEFLRQVLEAVVNQDEPEIKVVEPVNGRLESDRMRFAFPKFLLDAIDLRAKAQGMGRRRWIEALVQSNLTKNPVMNYSEVALLRANLRELGAIGRNINQIAKALNEAFHETERVRLDRLDELLKGIIENRKIIRALIRSSQDAWEAE